MRLLVVDDQAPVCAIICRIAQQQGWEAVHATSAKGILETLTDNAIEVLLIDFLIESNGRNGLAVIEDIRAAGHRLPILLFTGHPELVDQEKMKELGVLRLLAKPLSIQELRAGLNEARKGILDSPGS